VRIVAVVEEGQRVIWLVYKEGSSVKGDGKETWPPKKTDSNSDSVPTPYVALYRIPALTQEIPLPRGSPTRIWFNVVDVIKVGFQHSVSELI